VVWKHINNVDIGLNTALLRENHSGMETMLVSAREPTAEGLRENHSGMET